jgi:hypothetical protein
VSVGQWDQRHLCPDGACIGLIGDAGTCNVCGRAAPNWGEERKRGLKDESGPIVTPEPPSDPIVPGAPVAIGKAKDWTERQLCSDGSCIGVIGADGKCKVCGRAADGTPADDDDEYEDEDEDEDEDEGDDEGDVADYEEEDGDADEDAELRAAAEDLAASLPAQQDSESGVDRKLCPDGGCIGVIGSDGKCKVCGKESA